MSAVRLANPKSTISDGKPRYTQYYNGHSMEIFWAPQNWGSADGDALGVIGDSTTNQEGGGGGAATDGTQFFMMEDTDGLLHVETDEISLAGLDVATLDVDVHIESTSWESRDYVRVWAEDTGPMDDVVLLEAMDLDDHTEDEWVHYTADLTGFEGATIKFSMSSNSGAEEAWIDNIVITGSGNTPGGESPAALNCEEQTTVVLGMTSFEEPVRAESKSAGKYRDSLCSTVDGQNSVCDVPHFLINNAGQNPVGHTSSGGEMGFLSFYTPSRAVYGNVVSAAALPPGILSSLTESRAGRLGGRRRFRRGRRPHERLRQHRRRRRAGWRPVSHVRRHRRRGPDHLRHRRAQRRHICDSLGANAH